MDFGRSEQQDEIAGLARRILEDKATVALLRDVEAGDGERFDRGIWDALAEANLLGVALPTDVGGSGLGIIEQCLVLEQVGRTVAPVPVWASIVLGAMPVARFGGDELRRRWVPAAAEGRAILTAALAEPMNRWPERPGTVAERSGDGWVLRGTKTCVPAGTIADAILVPASLGDGQVGVFVVDPAAEGLTIEAQAVTNRDTEARLTLDGVHVPDGSLLATPERGHEVLGWIVERATIGLCAQVAGIVGRALEMTAAYTKERIQFDRPIATFQAVGQRAADAYIDVEATQLVLWQAAWRLSEGLPAAVEVEVAKFWAADAAHRVAHTAVHLHGGTGVDVDHPIHRYFIAAKELEFTLGGATDQLLRIGAAFAATPE
jgi:3-oxocholest-4-en-26-oyl-CoA dehydrogenase beta subunit